MKVLIINCCVKCIDVYQKMFNIVIGFESLIIIYY